MTEFTAETRAQTTTWQLESLVKCTENHLSSFACLSKETIIKIEAAKFYSRERVRLYSCSCFYQ